MTPEMMGCQQSDLTRRNQTSREHLHLSPSATSFHEIHLALFKPMLNSFSPFHHSPLFLPYAIPHLSLSLSGKNAYLKLLRSRWARLHDCTRRPKFMAVGCVILVPLFYTSQRFQRYEIHKTFRIKLRLLSRIAQKIATALFVVRASILSSKISKTRISHGKMETLERIVIAGQGGVES